jgi:hypothetical protein
MEGGERVWSVAKLTRSEAPPAIEIAHIAFDGADRYAGSSLNVPHQWTTVSSTALPCVVLKPSNLVADCNHGDANLPKEWQGEIVSSLTVL